MAPRHTSKNTNCKNPSLTLLLISLFRNAMPAYARQWEELTDIKVNFIEYGYTDIPSKIMAEAIARTGQYDISTTSPTSCPIAAGAGVLMPLDDYTERGRPELFRHRTGPARPTALQRQTVFFSCSTAITSSWCCARIFWSCRAPKKNSRRSTAGNPVARKRWRSGNNWRRFSTPGRATRDGARRSTRTCTAPWATAPLTFSYRHFPAYFGGLLFDQDMNPLVNTPGRH